MWTKDKKDIQIAGLGIRENFEKLTQESDMRFLEYILPSYYEITFNEEKNSYHCKSKNQTGISSDRLWDEIFSRISNKFGDRLSEVFHIVCTNHIDFKIYLK